MTSKYFLRAKLFKDNLEKVLPKEKYDFKLTRIRVSRGFGYTIKIVLDYIEEFSPKKTNQFKANQFMKKSSKYFSLIWEHISNTYDEDAVTLKSYDTINTDDNIYRSLIKILPKKPEDSDDPARFPLTKGEQVIEKIIKLIEEIKRKNTNTYHIEVHNPHITSPRTQGVGVTFRLRSTKPDERDPEIYFKRFLISKIILNLHEDFSFSTSIRGFINDREEGMKKCSYLCYFTDFGKSSFEINGEKFSQYYINMIEKLHSFGFYKRLLKHKSITHYLDIVERKVYEIKDNDFLSPYVSAFLFEKNLNMFFEENNLSKEDYREWKTKIESNKLIGQDPHISKLIFLIVKAFNYKWDFYEKKWKSLPLKFKINDYLELRFKNGITNIWVGKGEDKKIFTQCKYLLLNLPKNDQRIEEIKSIDEAEDYFSNDLEIDRKQIIDPRTEFWGHCSNLQAWFRYDYDTRLLHRNLAFPLLKELSKAGDPLAKKAFKEEIHLRLKEGGRKIFLYLLEQKLLRYVDTDNLLEILKRFDPKNELYDFIIKYNPSIFPKEIYTYLLPKIFESMDDSKILVFLFNYDLQKYLKYETELDETLRKLDIPLLRYYLEFRKSLRKIEYNSVDNHLSGISNSGLYFYLYYAPTEIKDFLEGKKEIDAIFINELSQKIPYIKKTDRSFRSSAKTEKKHKYRLWKIFSGESTLWDNIDFKYFPIDYDLLIRYVNLFFKNHTWNEIFLTIGRYIPSQKAHVLMLGSIRTSFVLTYLQFLEPKLQLRYDDRGVNISSFFRKKPFISKKQEKPVQSILTDFMEVNK
jgi:hypothetical protein